MEIQEIKQRLAIATVLHHYGLKPDPRHRLCCPFHEDTTPSMQVYDKTHTVYCFSSNCRTHGRSLDVIDFIMYREGIDKHHAILKAVELLDGHVPSTVPAATSSVPTPIAPATVVPTEVKVSNPEILTRMFTYFKNAVHNSAPAREYLESRQLDYHRLDVGYNSGQFHHGARKDEMLIKQCLQAGLLHDTGTISKSGDKAYRSFGKWCIVFPLRDRTHRITGLYFRSTLNDTDKRHYYLESRQGLYPYYPPQDTKKLILTESIIDAAGLLLNPDIANHYSILSCYGTNGLTAEHKSAIKGLKQLTEIIFFFDGDNAGREGVNRCGLLIRELLPDICLSAVTPPEGEDINSLLQGHDPDVLTHLLNSRTELLLSTEELVLPTEKSVLPPEEPILSTEKSVLQAEEPILPTQESVSQTEEPSSPTTIFSNETLSVENKLSKISPSSSLSPIPPISNPLPPCNHPLSPHQPPLSHQSDSSSPLDTTNPLGISYQGVECELRIKGFNPRQIDSLKVSVQIIDRETRHDHRTKLDLYEYRQVGSTARVAAERLHLRRDLLEGDFTTLTSLLESYRDRHLADSSAGVNQPRVKVSEATQSRCISFLSSSDLLGRINRLIGLAGVAGEENNRLLLFIVAGSYKMPDTLHALIQGSSGSGKTRLLKSTSGLMPPEDVKSYTRVTDNSFYNQDEYFFVHKLLCFEDIDGLKEDAQLAVRELQSNEILVTSTSIKDENGAIRGGERTVRGPIASLACTTKGEMYEDNVSRCFVIAVDESSEQTLKIIKYQNDRAAGIVDIKKERTTKEFLQNCIRLLRPYEVLNPYANRIHLPQEAHKLRRLNELYQSFVRQLTLVHQYQRSKDKSGRLITDIEDLQNACTILFESIVLKVDELDGSLRQFYERLKEYVSGKGNRDYEFNRFEIRTATGVSKTQQHYYLTRLLELEYIKQYGYANRGFRYRISHWDNMAALRSRIRESLQGQLQQLRQEQQQQQPPQPSHEQPPKPIEQSKQQVNTASTAQAEPTPQTAPTAMTLPNASALSTHQITPSTMNNS